MQKTQVLQEKPTQSTNGKSVLTDHPMLDRGMNLEECRAIYTSPQIHVREKLFFRIRIIFELNSDMRELYVIGFGTQKHLKG